MFRPGRYDEAIVLYDAAISGLEDATDRELLVDLGDAMIAKGKSLFTEERFEEAIEVFDRLIERFGPMERSLRKPAALALNNKVAALNRLGRTDEAVETHAELVSSFGDETIAAFDDTIGQVIDAVKPLEREQLAGALASKATLLTELKRQDEAIAAFTQLVDTFDGDDEPPLIAHVVTVAREARREVLEAGSEDE